MLADVLTAYLLEEAKMAPRKLRSDYAVNNVGFLNKFSHQNGTIGSAAGAAQEPPGQPPRTGCSARGPYPTARHVTLGREA